MKTSRIPTLATAAGTLLIAALLPAAGCNGTYTGNGGGGTIDRRAPAGCFTFAAPPRESGSPELTAEEARALFLIARLDPLKARDLGTMRKVMNLPDRMFESHGGFVSVNLHVPGRTEPLSGAAAGGNLAFSVAGAARNALGAADPGLLASARIRIDLVYDLAPCAPGTRMIPGIEGLATVAGKTQALLTADRYLADKPDITAYILTLEKMAGLPEGTWKKNQMMLAKFRSSAWVQLEPGETPVGLYRSNVLIEPPDAGQCRRAAARALAWLRAAQKADGSFRYEYSPYANTYELEQYNVLRHAGAAFSLFAGARLRLESRPAPAPGKAGPSAVTVDPSFAAGERALGYVRKVSVKDPRFDFVYVPDGSKVKLGAAALSLVAFCERERAGGDDSNREFMNALARFILKHQTPEGEFISHYDPDKGTPVKEFISLYYPGEALLGLLRLYRLGGRKDARLLEACHLGAGYLIDFERRGAAENLKKGVKPGAVFPPDAWLLQALDELIEIDDRPDYRKHAFELADCMAAGQLTAVGEEPPARGEATRFFDLLGAIDEGDPPAAASTGARCEGLVSALRIARRVGDAARAAHYEETLRLASRFVSQNQYHPHNAYALPAPERALGGFRLDPLTCRIRIDYVQHCASFLMEWAGLMRPIPAPGAAPVHGRPQRDSAK